MTRIVAGAARGRRLAVPAGGTRPTTDRVREALFNVLATRLDLHGAHVLDLYAGSGALGLEALSRGAATVVFVEDNRRAAEVIVRNIATVGLPGGSLRRQAVSTVLASGPGPPVDLVLADPPYDTPVAEVDAVLVALDSHGWMAPGGVVVVERPVSSAPLSWPPGWRAWAPRRYGDTRVEAADC